MGVMKKMVMVAVVVGLVGAGAAVAGTLPGMQAWAVRSGTNGVVSQLTVYGMTNQADRTALTRAWDEDVLVDTALRNRAYGVLVLVMTRDKLTPVSMGRVKNALLAETAPPPAVLDVICQFPVAERAQFQAVAEVAAVVRYVDQPEFGRLSVKYSVLRGTSVFAVGTNEQDLVRLLLAPEPLSLAFAENCKKAIKDGAVVLARVKLRAEGKSFVVKNGVNPLVVMVQSVVTALNAQECAGLEAALRGLGSDVQDVDRKSMRDLVAGWQPRMMAGEMVPGEVSQVLGKIAVALGPDAYNRFVDAYNNGTVGAK